MVAMGLQPMAGELFASIVARYAALLRIPVTPAFRTSALGRNTACRSLLLPTRLVDCEGRAPFGRLSCQDILRDHTAVPYFRSFLLEDRALRLNDAVRHGWGTSSPAALRISSVRGHGTLNYCRACRSESTRFRGPGPWFLRHQMPGVFRCAKHDEALMSSGLMPGALSNDFLPCPPRDHGSSKLDPGTDVATARKLTQITDHLLSYPRASLSRDGLRARARSMLERAGWMHESGFVRNGARADFERFYGSAFLDRVGCGLSEPAWFNDMVGAQVAGHHPLRYILLMAFTGAGPDDFLSEMPEAPLVRKGKLDTPRPGLLEFHRARIDEKFSPDATRSQVRRSNPKRFRLMLAYDSDWLNLRFPLGPPQVRRKESKDEVYVRQLAAAVERLGDRHGPKPIKIRPGVILQEAGLPNHLRANQKLVLCRDFLTKATESPKSFLLRKILWLSCCRFCGHAA